MTGEIRKITLITKTAFHTSGISTGSNIDFIVDRNKRPVIPASLVKGVMRTEAERIYRVVKEIKCDITGNKNQTCDEIKRGEFGCEICRLFGSPNYGDAKYIEGKLRFTDFTALKYKTSNKTHVAMDVDSGTKREHGLYNLRVIQENTEFIGFIIIKNSLSTDEEKLFNASLKSMADYGLGGERSRGIGSFEVNSKQSNLEELFNISGGVAHES